MERQSVRNPLPKGTQDARYDHPAYQAAFRELNELLVAEFDRTPWVEYMDTMMYGFWGEAHTWPFEGNIFPNNVVAEQTWMKMLETQLDLWTKVPLVTNTAGFQPRRKCRSPRSHHPHSQLDSDGYDFHREHANRGSE